MKNYSEISRKLQDWYHKHKRDLPWRTSKDPYFIWVSEIMLQQTRVDQGESYYLRFIERFPDVYSLAEADETEVLKLWQGLGYYSRARNMHKAAKHIVSNFGRCFPNSYKDLLQLKGVGDYTASAIASIAYNQPYATVDGNVFRVLSRLFEIGTSIDTTSGKNEFKELAFKLLDEQNPGTHNQALMELGALICTPRAAKCEECPLQTFCSAFEHDTIYDFPQKKNKIVQQIRYFNYFYITHGDSLYIQKRLGNDIWKNLYEFPLIETKTAQSLADLMVLPEFQEILGQHENICIKHEKQFKHILTHQILFVDFYSVKPQCADNFSMSGNFMKVNRKDIHFYPVSSLIEKFISIFLLKEL